MKKICIITIYDLSNYGNRLQNYALQRVLENYGFNVVTLKNNPTLNSKNYYPLRLLKFWLNNTKEKLLNFRNKRYIQFKKFETNINESNEYFNLYKKEKVNSEYDYFIVGSDQIWNPEFYGMREFDLLTFTNPEKRISYSASFGVSQLPEKYNSLARKELKLFKSLSVREDSGKKIIENLTGRDDVEVLIDPTMLLSCSDWEKVAIKPKEYNGEDYILNYFLGNLSTHRKEEIERLAKKNNWKIINLFDRNDPYYNSGPAEFLWLEKNAKLICTDSFHSSVFSIIFDKPFIVFDREQKGVVRMSSRITTLLNKFDLKDRKYNGKSITSENLNHDYTEAYELLDRERKKSTKFLEKALDISK